MRIRLITISHKAPEWVMLGFNEYAKRLPPTCTLELIEIPANKSSSPSNIERIVAEEGEKLLAATKPLNHLIALDTTGKMWSSEQLAQHLSSWQQQGRNIDLVVGGANGLSDKCLQKAETKWSLSLLTFPHLLVRVIVAEQIYRAWSILQGHPYHK